MLYLYQAQSLSPEAWQGFLQTLRDHNLQAVLWDTEDIPQRVADLLAQGPDRALGPDDLAPGEGSAEGSPFLLMALPKEGIDPVVQSLRAHACIIPHKAMVTSRNQAMVLKDLILEVAEEHALMGQLMTLQKLLAASADFPAEAYPPDAWATYQSKRHEAQDLLGQVGKREIPLKEAEGVVAAFNQSVLKLLEKGGQDDA